MEKSEAKKYDRVGIKINKVFDVHNGAKVIMGDFNEPKIEEIEKRHGDEVLLKNGETKKIKSLYQAVYSVPIKQYIRTAKYKVGGAVLKAEQDEKGYYIEKTEDRKVHEEDYELVKKALCLYAKQEIKSIFALIDTKSTRLKGFEVDNEKFYSQSEFAQR